MYVVNYQYDFAVLVVFCEAYLNVHEQHTTERLDTKTNTHIPPHIEWHYGHFKTKATH